MLGHSHESPKTADFETDTGIEVNRVSLKAHKVEDQAQRQLIERADLALAAQLSDFDTVPARGETCTYDLTVYRIAEITYSPDNLEIRFFLKSRYGR